MRADLDSAPDCQSRQRHLPEVGEAGQRRLAASRARVHGSGPAADTEADYLSRAGLGSVERAPDEAPEPFAHAAVFAHPAAAALAAGAWRALAQLRRTLGVEPR